MRVRRYIAEDIPHIIELVREFVTEAPAYKDVPFRPAMLERALGANVPNMMFFCNVVVIDEQIVGGMAARLFNYAFSDELFAQDIYLYVRPSDSAKSAVRQLNEDYLEWAKARHVRAARMSFSHGDMEAHKPFERLATHMGYAPVGYIWEMRP